MGKRANPVVVGSFVLGGIVLAVTVIAMVGSGSFFRHKQRLIAYFDGSVNGLDVGAPVKFRGVPIGRVTGVRLRLPAQPVDDRRIPVVVEIDQDRLIELGESKAVVSDEKVAEHLVAQGLRAQLELESFITGVLFLVIEKDNRFVRFHAMQSTVVFLAIVGIDILLQIVPILGALVVVFLVIPASAVLSGSADFLL